MPSFEEQLEELEQVIARLEEGNLSLEESVSLFERGVVLSRGCKKILASAESRVEAVLAPEDDGPVQVEEIAVAVADEDEEGDAIEPEDDEDISTGRGR